MQRERSITRLCDISSNYSHVIYTVYNAWWTKWLECGDRDDTCCHRTKDGIRETRSDDERVRMTMRIAISLWTQQATPARGPITHAFVFGVTRVKTGRWKFNRDAKESNLNAEWVLSIGCNLGHWADDARAAVKGGGGPLQDSRIDFPVSSPTKASASKQHKCVFSEKVSR